MAFGIPSVALVVTASIILLAYRYGGGVGGAIVTIYLAYTTISVKGLADAAKEVLARLDQGDLEGARKALSMVVGRDTAGLDPEGIVRGAVETVSENASDGVVAPLFYLALGGPALAMAYKAVNTMDSMVGYKDERYTDFGRGAAKLDDILNYIPARLTGVLIALAAFLLGLVGQGGRFSWKGSWRIFLRDRANHESPNSGQPEAAMAGALSVWLGGESSYKGIIKVKPYIGEPTEPLSPTKISDAVRLLYVTSVIMLTLAIDIAYVNFFM